MAEGNAGRACEDRRGNWRGGARFYAQQQGYKVIFDGKGRVLRQGPDQVYLDLRTGETVVIEAKGGTSPL
ncbi:MAG: hypothetical protein ACUVQG_14765, partial [Thermogutta sp.]